MTRTGWRRTLLVITSAVLVGGAAGGSTALSVAADGLSAQGLWFGTVYFGDPGDPATPKEQFTATIHADGTYLVDSTAETGSHPLNPGAKTPEQGVWTQRGRRLSSRGLWFDEAGGGLGFSVGRSVSRLEFESRDRLSGLYDIDFLPCPAGPLGCPDPVEAGPLALGDGVGPFPVVLRRVP